MHNQIEVSYIDGQHDKFHVKSFDAYIIDTIDGIKLLTIFTEEGQTIEINWDCVKKIGYYPAPFAKKEPEKELNFEETMA